MILIRCGKAAGFEQLGQARTSGWIQSRMRKITLELFKNEVNCFLKSYLKPVRFEF
jgi:hypothetical protein